MVPEVDLGPTPPPAVPASAAKGASIKAPPTPNLKPATKAKLEGKVEAISAIQGRPAPESPPEPSATSGSVSQEPDSSKAPPQRKAEPAQQEQSNAKKTEEPPASSQAKAATARPEPGQQKLDVATKAREPEPPIERATPPGLPQSAIDASRSVAGLDVVKPPLTRLQAERALAKDSSVLFVRQDRKKSEPASEQILFNSERKAKQEMAPVFGTSSSEPVKKGAVDLDRDRVIWLKEKGLIAPGKGDFRTQVLNAEERVVHKALVSLVPKTVLLSSVHIVTGSSKVHAQVESRRGEKLDGRSLQKLRQDFERQTGRQLVLERPASAGAPTGSASTRPAAPSAPSPAPRTAARVPAVEPPGHESRRPAPPAREAREPGPLPAAAPSTRKVKHVSYALAGAESAGAAAAAAAHGAAVLALNPLVVIDPKIGTLEGLRQIENRWSPTSTPGGSSKTRVYQPPQPETEDDKDPRTQQQTEENQKSTGVTESKGKGKGPAGNEAAERLVHAERLSLEDATERSEQERGGRGGRSHCRCCGTELPEAQKDACPVCAQSGPDVIATTSVNYRFAGSKFLAAADSVAASSQARGVLEQGLAESVVSLRYRPKIPGHKDFLRFRAIP